MAGHPLYDRRFLYLVKVGGETGKLDLIFDKLAKQYAEEVSHKTGLMGSMVESVSVIFLGLVIGVILVAMYLPLFQLSLDV